MIPTSFRVFLTAAIFLALVATWSALASLSHADDFSPRSTLHVSLSKPMTSIVDGQPFRTGMSRIADQAKVNLCLDRRVDPSRPIDAGPVGPTVFAAMEKLATSHDCVIAPIDNVLLVGRAEWVDQTMASLLALKRAASTRRTTVQWEDLTTPTEALRTAAGNEANMQLPHDLWPKTTWRGVDPKTAVALVLAQFDQHPEFTGPTASDFRPVDANRPAKVTRYYHPGTRGQEIREEMETLEPQHQINVAGNRLKITASPAAHRKLVAKLMETDQPAGADPKRDTFTVRKMTTSAANALQQLAASAGRQCIIDPAATEACKRIVTVEGKDVTLQQLVDRIANQAGVKVKWQNDSILVTP